MDPVAKEAFERLTAFTKEKTEKKVFYTLKE